MKSLSLGLILLCFVCCRALAADSAPDSSAGPDIAVLPPAPAQYFNDYAEIILPKVAAGLNGKLAAFDRETGNQVVVAIFPRKDSIASLADYCLQIFNHWGVGQKDKNNGVCLFVFMTEHKLRIETGLGMDRVLSSNECQRILNQEITPKLRQHDFDGGMTAGVNAILKSIRQGGKPADAASGSGQ